MTSSFSRMTGAAVAACCLATPAWGQQAGRADRPYRGLFGGDVSGLAQSLSANASIGTAFDNNMLAVASTTPGGIEELRIATANGRRQGRNYSYMSAGLSYSLNKSRVGLGASLGTSGQYVPGVTTSYIPSYSAGLGASFQLSRRSRLTAGHSISLQPYNALVFGPPLVEPALGQVFLIEPTFGVRRENHVTQSSGVGFGRQVGRRASLDLNYAYRQSRSSSGIDDMTSQSAGGRFSMGFTKGLGGHLGYGYSEGHLGGDSPIFVGRNIDAGLDFSRTLGLSVSRRTKLSFSTGSSVISNGVTKRFALTGNAALIREIARSWAASLVYNRGMGFVERFRQPFFTDSLTLGGGGLITRRLDFRAAASAVVGKAGFTRDATAFRSYSGSAGLTMGITRSLGVGGAYSYYRYGFDQAGLLPTGVEREMGRHSARVYLSVWVPLLQRGRRPDASR